MNNKNLLKFIFIIKIFILNNNFNSDLNFINYLDLISKIKNENINLYNEINENSIDNANNDSGAYAAVKYLISGITPPS